MNIGFSMTVVIGRAELWLWEKKLTAGVTQQSYARKLRAVNNRTTIVPPRVNYS